MSVMSWHLSRCVVGSASEASERVPVVVSGKQWRGVAVSAPDRGGANCKFCRLVCSVT